LIQSIVVCTKPHVVVRAYTYYLTINEVIQASNREACKRVYNYN